MARSLSLLYLALASPAVLLSFVVGGPAAEVVFTILVMGFPVALIALATARKGRLGPPLRLPLFLLLVVLEGTSVGMLALRGKVMALPWFAGLPLAAVLLLVLWLAPLPVVALGYALTFERRGFDQEERDSADGGGAAGEDKR